MRSRPGKFLLCLLTSLWLCASPWAHAQRMQDAPANAVQPEAPAAAEVPCHGMDHAMPEPASPDAESCCEGAQCQGQCAQISWAMVEGPPVLLRRSLAMQPSIDIADLLSRRQPELFRPPI